MAGIARKLVAFFVLLASAESSTCPKAGCETCIPGETCAKELMALPQDASSFIQTRSALNSDKHRGDDQEALHGQPEPPHPEVSLAAQAEAKAEASRAEPMKEKGGEGAHRRESLPLHVFIKTEDPDPLPLDVEPEDDVYMKVGEALHKSSEELEIFFAGSEVPRQGEGSTFEQAGIEDEGTLTVHDVLRVDVVYYDLHGEDHRMKFDCDSTVKDLGDAIKAAMGDDRVKMKTIDNHNVADAQWSRMMTEFDECGPHGGGELYVVLESTVDVVYYNDQVPDRHIEKFSCDSTVKDLGEAIKAAMGDDRVKIKTIDNRNVEDAQSGSRVMTEFQECGELHKEGAELYVIIEFGGQEPQYA